MFQISQQSYSATTKSPYVSDFPAIFQFPPPVFPVVLLTAVVSQLHIAGS